MWELLGAKCTILALRPARTILSHSPEENSFTHLTRSLRPSTNSRENFVTAPHLRPMRGLLLFVDMARAPFLLLGSVPF
jgi:hypothetical protein